MYLTAGFPSAIQSLLSVLLGYAYLSAELLQNRLYVSNALGWLSRVYSTALACFLRGDGRVLNHAMVVIHCVDLIGGWGRLGCPCQCQKPKKQITVISPKAQNHNQKLSIDGGRRGTASGSESAAQRDLYYFKQVVFYGFGVGLLYLRSTVGVFVHPFAAQTVCVRLRAVFVGATFFIISVINNIWSLICGLVTNTPNKINIPTNTTAIMPSNTFVNSLTLPFISLIDLA